MYCFPFRVCSALALTGALCVSEGQNTNPDHAVDEGLLKPKIQQVRVAERHALQRQASDNLRRTPPSLSVKLSNPVEVVLPPLSAKQLLKLIPRSRAELTGVTRSLPDGTLESVDSGGRLGVRVAGAWSWLPDGLPVWRLRIRSPNAAAIRVHFEEFDVGSGRVWLYGGSREKANFVGPYSGLGPQGRGQFWSGTVFSDSVIIEYVPDLSTWTGELAPFSVSGISHALSNPYRVPRSAAPPSFPQTALPAKR